MPTAPNPDQLRGTHPLLLGDTLGKVIERQAGSDTTTTSDATCARASKRNNPDPERRSVRTISPRSTTTAW